MVTAATVRMPVPMMGKIRYVPDAEMVRPAVMEPVRMPTVKVIIMSPASVGVSPLTSWRYIGSMAIAPNIPMPMMKFSSEDSPNVVFRKSRSGISA